MHRFVRVAFVAFVMNEKARRISRPYSVPLGHSDAAGLGVRRHALGRLTVFNTSPSLWKRRERVAAHAGHDNLTSISGLPI